MLLADSGKGRSLQRGRKKRTEEMFGGVVAVGRGWGGEVGIHIGILARPKLGIKGFSVDPKLL